MELLEPIFLMNDDTLLSVVREGKGYIKCDIEGEKYDIWHNEQREVTSLAMGGYFFYTNTIEEYQKELNEKVQWLYTQSKHRVKLLY
jgi:hypothetical protein